MKGEDIMIGNEKTNRRVHIADEENK